MRPKTPPRRSKAPAAKSPLRATISRRLKGAARPALLAVGSTLRGDDAAGLLVAQYVKELQRSRSARLKIFLGGAAPENLTGPIKGFAPTHLIVVDSAQFGARPGAIRVLDSSDAGGMTFSTHSLPLSVMLDYLADSLKCETLVLGIEPKTLEFGAAVSKSVDLSSRRLALIIHEALTTRA